MKKNRKKEKKQKNERFLKDQIFSPSFGNRPRILVGRDELLSGLVQGLQTAPGSKDRAVLLLGQRGYGKTVLLLEIADQARQCGYLAVPPTVVARGMLNRILEKVKEEAGRSFPGGKKKITGGSIGLLGFSAGIQLKDDEKEARSFSARLSDLCRSINAQGKGLLLLIDEVQPGSEELRELLIAYQELVGEEMNIAIMMAGLPHTVSSALNDHVLTFLNRAKKIDLPPLKTTEIEVYYQRVFREIGISISSDQISAAAESSEGSPYLMQLIGHYITLGIDPETPVTSAELEQALQFAHRDFMNDICSVSIRSLSEKDIAFLTAMAEDEKGSRIADIAARLQVSLPYAQLYKRRLIQAGVIEQVRRGIVRPTIPRLKEYLKISADN